MRALDPSAIDHEDFGEARRSCPVSPTVQGGWYLARQDDVRAPCATSTRSCRRSATPVSWCRRRSS